MTITIERERERREREREREREERERERERERELVKGESLLYLRLGLLLYPLLLQTLSKYIFKATIIIIIITIIRAKTGQKERRESGRRLT